MIDLIEKEIEAVKASAKSVKGVLHDQGFVAGLELAKNIIAKASVPVIPPDAAKLKAKIVGLFDIIKHGDASHQDWLRRTINQYFEL